MTVLQQSLGKTSWDGMQGADTVIYERLDQGNKLNAHLKRVTRDHMESYGEAGLRTLCLACVELDPAAYDA